MATFTPESPVATFPQYTNLALGEGLFDQLMKSIDRHLDQQYKQQRLRGTQYAEVYVGALQGVMQNTTQYLLGTMLLPEQRKKMIAETALIIKQQELIDLEKEKLRFEIDELYPLQKTKTESEIELIDAQILKIGKEIEFLTAKILTEQANTQSGVASTDSLIGRQMSLLQAQKLGFAGDLQVKSAKLFSDYDAVVESVNENGQAVLGAQATSAIGDATSTATAIAAIV